VAKDVDDEYSDIEWEDVVVGVEREVVKQTVVVVVRETVGRGSDKGQAKSRKSTDS
jgi:hypothetical protein